MVLLEDEKNVMRWLSQYGPLENRQLIKLLKCSDRVAFRIMKNLRKFYLISEVNGGRFYGTDPYGQPDRKMVTAVWVLIHFAEQIDPMAHHPADEPAQVFFLKENTQYEIVVIDQGEEHLLRILRPRAEVKYIIVVPNMDIVDQLPLPEAPCLFAMVTAQGEDEPAVTFYAQEEDSD